MTPQEITKLLESLTEEEALVRKQLAEVSIKDPDGGLQPKRTEYGDPDDEDSYAHEVTDIDKNLAMERELKARLEEIVKAKEKIKAGQYGKCDNCSQAIHPERLKAKPVAALCVSCASRK